ncbi:MAG: hypothetical protein WEF50_12200 [Myxococcota bacterium]
MILGSLALIVTLSLLVLSFFVAEVASWIYVTVVVGLDLLVFAADRTARTPPERLALSAFETEVFERHSVYIRLPGGASEVCAALQATRWLSLLWLPWLLWSQLWWPAGILAAHFAITAAISVRMNPVGPYLMAAQEGNSELGRQAAVIQDLLARMHGFEPDDDADHAA